MIIYLLLPLPVSISCIHLTVVITALNNLFTIPWLSFPASSTKSLSLYAPHCSGILHCVNALVTCLFLLYSLHLLYTPHCGNIQHWIILTPCLSLSCFLYPVFIYRIHLTVVIYSTELPWSISWLSLSCFFYQVSIYCIHLTVVIYSTESS